MSVWHNFPYREIFTANLGDTFQNDYRLSRPALDVVLKNGPYQATCLALVDSGADFCIFPTRFIKELGLRSEDATHVPDISGFGAIRRIGRAVLESNLLHWGIVFRRCSGRLFGAARSR